MDFAKVRRTWIYARVWSGWPVRVSASNPPLALGRCVAHIGYLGTEEDWMLISGAINTDISHVA